MSQEYENARLRAANHELLVLCTELRLQLTFTNAEMAVLRNTNRSLERDLHNLRAEVSGWMESEERRLSSRSVFERRHFLPLLLDQRVMSIEDALQANHTECVLLTAASAPFHVEYTNRHWIEFCGWEAHEVLGLDCAFFQGPDTNLQTAAELIEDLTETAFGRMRITNYKKNGTRFNATVSVYPVYDTDQRGEPCLTHMASYFSDVEELPRADKELPDLRHNCKGVWPTPSLSKKQFASFASIARLNDLLRYATTTQDAVVLTDHTGRIVHTNRAWTELFQYPLRSVEGLTCAFLQGPMTDSETISKSNKLMREGQIVDMKVFNYVQDGSVFFNHATIVPIHSATKPSQVTHFVGHSQRVSVSASSDGIDSFRVDQALLLATSELIGRTQSRSQSPISGVTEFSLTSAEDASDGEQSDEEDMHIV